MQSKRCLLFILIALLYSAQTKLEAQGCNPDITPPVAVCDEFTQVALGANGLATVFANTFDDGSYDACCAVTFKVKRQDDGPCDADGLPDDFADDITFCCGDLANSFFIVLRVTDCAGNFTDCATILTVEDKVKPVCLAPADVTVLCSDFDPTLVAYGLGSSTDNCCMDTTVVLVNNNQFSTNCLSGTIVRTFQAYDCSSNSSQCTQSIVVNQEQNYFVKFPNDLILSAFDPNGSYGEPTFFQADCELLGTSYSDQVFTVDPDADVKIERTWTIINWCSYNPNLGVVTIPNPNPNSVPNHPANLPGPTVSAPGTQAPWSSTISKITPLDPAPTDFSTFWDANANAYQYKQIIKIIDTFFVAVQGKVFSDTSASCAYETGEALLGNWTVKATGLTTGQVKEIVTDANGYYSVIMNGIDTVVNITLVSSGNFGQNCQTNYNVNCTVGEIVDQDIPVHLEERCALLSVGITTPILRRCFDNHYVAEACNLSGETVADAYVDVDLDAYLDFVDSSIPATLVGGNIYRFELGDLEPGDCRRFWLDVTVNCTAPLGYTHCTEAKIYPFDDCRGNSNWSGADVDVTASCDGDSVRLKITNIGNGAMAQSLDFVVVEDIIMLQDGGFQLGVGEEYNIAFPANGSTWRLEAQEEPLHPFGGVQAVALEGCGGLNQTGLVNLFPLSDDNPFEGIDCQQNIGSFDPNDKQAFPAGFGSDHYLKTNTDIEYLIRFQNTGTDTAFTVKVLDTLSQYLSPASVRVLATSHPMEFSILEGGVLQFLFNNIMLPDSNVNTPESNGFLKFRVAQNLDNQEGIRIENDAAIFFDFNEPVITNTTFHTINNHFLTVGIDDPLHAGSGLTVYPNPAADIAMFKMENPVENARFELTNQMGQLVKAEKFSGNQYRFERSGIQSGVYFFKIAGSNGAVFTGKILVQ